MLGMSLIKNSNVIVKFLIPIGLLLIMALGIVAYSRHALLNLADQAQAIVDVQASRQEQILKLQINITESTIQNRNIIIETRADQMSGYKTRHDAAISGAIEAINRLVALADSAERRQMNERLLQSAQSFFSILNRSTTLGLRNEAAAAMKIAQEEASPARAALREQVQRRIDGIVEELAQAKLAAREAAERAANLLIVSAVIGLLLATILAVAIGIFGITRPLASLVGVLQRMARGEIDAEIREATRGDEIGAVGKAVEGIKAMVARKAPRRPR
ncbi:hypothetical protein CTI14_08695 [Methylobacterium radiotolerans]|nr:hypothetical protein CTI14_08695 [Methylobacterium radiotolerans]